MKASDLHGRSLLLLGYGREGKSTHRWLLEDSKAGRIAVCDRAEFELIAEAPKTTECFYGEGYLAHLAEFDVIFRSPGIPRRMHALQEIDPDTTLVSSLTNLFFSNAPGTIIGVSGTKGKSTTASLLHHILSLHYADVRLVGNIGLPALDHLEGAGDETIFVAELSSFQLEDAQRSPHTAILLEVVPEHLDHHGSFKEYLNAKLAICRTQDENDCFITFAKQYASLPETELGRGRKILLDPGDPQRSAVYLDNDVLREQGGEQIISFKELPYGSTTAVENIVAAAAAALQHKVPMNLIAEGIRTFKPLPYRLEPLGSFSGITFFNDSLATIPEACIHALKSLGSKVQTLIVGGFDRGIDYSELAAQLALRADSLQTILLLPTTGQKIADALYRSFPEEAANLRLQPVASMEEAVALAFEHTSPGRICLLSPASSSLNMFANYQERGDAFRRAILAESAAREEQLNSE